jgi:hypothetical protein
MGERSCEESGHEPDINTYEADYDDPSGPWESANCKHCGEAICRAGEFVWEEWMEGESP